MAAPDRYPLLLTTQRVLPIAIAIAAAGAVWSEGWARAGSIGFAVFALAIALWQASARPTLLLDERGYAVEERGREKLRVAWNEVLRVRVDAAEHALYLDCGDPSRNLLVPPRRGFGFRFARAEELCARVLERIPPENVERVARLDAPVEKIGPSDAPHR